MTPQGDKAVEENSATHGTIQYKLATYQSDFKRYDREFIVESGASLTLGQQNTGDFTVNLTSNGMAESTQEATAHVNDLDVSVTMMLFEDSPAVPSFGFFMARNWLYL